MTPVHWITVEEPGGLAIMPRPHGGDWLADEVRAWRSTGVEIVVSALEPLEESLLELGEEETVCRRLGIDFRRFAILDRSTPPLDADTRQQIGELAALVRDGRRVAVHCRVGIGRSGLLCAAILVSLGLDPVEAFLRISAARGMDVPDTQEQIDWVFAYAGRNL